MAVVKVTKHVGWIEMSDQKLKKIPSQVRGWKVNYNEITNKVNFFLKEIQVKIQNKCQVSFSVRIFVC